MTALPHELVYTYHDSPIGQLLLAGDGDALHLISFPGGSRTKRPDANWKQDGAAFKSVKAQLESYFAGELKAFDVAFTLNGTPFQKSVWMALCNIPYGETVSYGAIANAVALPAASRAVGAANGANPIPIVIPCHRVIGANGALTGFGGGLDTKRFLLRHESENGSQGSLFVSGHLT